MDFFRLKYSATCAWYLPIWRWPTPNLHLLLDCPGGCIGCGVASMGRGKYSKFCKEVGFRDATSKWTNCNPRADCKVSAPRHGSETTQHVGRGGSFPRPEYFDVRWSVGFLLRELCILLRPHRLSNCHKCCRWGIFRRKKKKKSESRLCKVVTHWLILFIFLSLDVDSKGRSRNMIHLPCLERKIKKKKLIHCRRDSSKGQQPTR